MASWPNELRYDAQGERIQNPAEHVFGRLSQCVWLYKIRKQVGFIRREREPREETNEEILNMVQEDKKNIKHMVS